MQLLDLSPSELSSLKFYVNYNICVKLVRQFFYRLSLGLLDPSCKNNCGNYTQLFNL